MLNVTINAEDLPRITERLQQNRRKRPFATGKVSEECCEHLQFLRSNRYFLGHEFLTWLYFNLTYVEGRKLWNKFDISLGDKVVLGNSTLSSTHKGDCSRGQQGIRKQLLQGHKIAGLSLYLTDGECTWSFFIEGSTMQLRAVRVPAIKAFEDTNDMLQKRMENLKVPTDFLEAKFSEYMSVRRYELDLKSFAEEFTETLEGAT